MSDSLPILDTVVLFAAADEDDSRNEIAEKFLRSLQNGNNLIASYSLVEMDIVLKSRGCDSEKRKLQQGLLLKDFPGAKERVHPLSPETIFLGASLEKKYDLDYFDAMIAAEALEHDGEIASTDEAFDRVQELERVW